MAACCEKVVKNREIQLAEQYIAVYVTTHATNFLNLHNKI